MAPYHLQSEMLKSLRALRKQMASANWLLALETATPATRTHAAKLSLRVNHAIRKLENSQLSEIRDAMTANEPAIKAGIDEVGAAKKKLRKVEAVLDIVDRFMAVVQRVVTLI